MHTNYYIIIEIIIHQKLDKVETILHMFSTYKTAHQQPYPNYFWSHQTIGKLEKIGGSDFSAWASEYVPAYRLEIDTKILGDSKIGGWKKSAENRWEVLLTHSQMVF